MRVLLLDKLQPGDLVVETGDRFIAAATGGPFGHASVVLGRLVKLEAGEEGVHFYPFEFVTLRNGDERLVGVPIAPGDEMKVLRRKEAVDIGRLRGEALWEAGREYSLLKLRDLPDLKRFAQAKLEEKITEGGDISPEEAREQRFCSEVAAKVLRLSPSLISPNALAAAPELMEVTDAISELDGEWHAGEVMGQFATIDDELGRIRVGLAAILQRLVKLARQRLSQGLETFDDAVDKIDAVIRDEITDSLQRLNDIEALEPSVFPEERSPI